MTWNDQIIVLAAIFPAAYLLGSINFSIIVARLMGKGDLRKLGSKNAGATNLRRQVGWTAAIIVLILDLARACGVILTAHTLGLGDAAPAAALPLLLGNLYPAFHSFKGGKGVAASVGIVLAISWPSLLAAGVVFLVALAISKRISLGSMLMALAWPVCFWFFDLGFNAILVATTMSLIILLTHRANIRRLVKGNEPTLHRKTEAENKASHQ